jgi:hypothetical protein
MNSSANVTKLFSFIAINSSAKRYKHFYIHVRKLFKITRSSSANVTILCLLVMNSSAHVTKDFLMSQWAALPNVTNIYYIAMKSSANVMKLFPRSCSANVMSLFLHCNEQPMLQTIFLPCNEQQCQYYETFSG